MFRTAAGAGGGGAAGLQPYQNLTHKIVTGLYEHAARVAEASGATPASAGKSATPVQVSSANKSKKSGGTPRTATDAIGTRDDDDEGDHDIDLLAVPCASVRRACVYGTGACAADAL